jgi:hypothetical protein
VCVCVRVCVRACVCRSRQGGLQYVILVPLSAFCVFPPDYYGIWFVLRIVFRLLGLGLVYQASADLYT